MPNRSLLLLVLSILWSVWCAAGEIDREAMAGELDEHLRRDDAERKKIMQLADSCGVTIPAAALAQVDQQARALRTISQRLRDPGVPVAEIPWREHGQRMSVTSRAWSQAKRRLELALDAPDTFRELRQTTAYARYETFLRSEVIALVMGEPAALDKRAEAAFDRALSCHLALLGALTREMEQTRRWPHVPPDHPARQEFATHVQGVIAAAEDHLRRTDSDPAHLARDDAALRVLIRLIDCEEQRLREPYPAAPDDPLLVFHDQVVADLHAGIRARLAAVRDPAISISDSVRRAATIPPDEILLADLADAARAGLRGKVRLQQRQAALNEALAAAPGEIRQRHHETVVALGRARDQLATDRLAALTARDPLAVLTIGERQLRLDYGLRDLTARIEKDTWWQDRRRRWNEVAPDAALVNAIAAADEAYTAVLTAGEHQTACEIARWLEPLVERRERLRPAGAVTAPENQPITRVTTEALTRAGEAVTQAHLVLNQRMAEVERLLKR